MPFTSGDTAYVLTAEDLDIVARVQADGLAFVPDLLTAEEVFEARRDFDAAYSNADAAAGSGAPDDSDMYYRNALAWQGITSASCRCAELLRPHTSVQFPNGPATNRAICWLP